MARCGKVRVADHPDECPECGHAVSVDEVLCDQAATLTAAEREEAERIRREEIRHKRQQWLPH